MILQKVRSAMQLVSNTTATCLERYFPDRQEEGRVVRLFDKMTDVLNGIHPGDRKPLRRGYQGSEEQEQVLDEASRELAVMRFGASSVLYPFQKGLLVTIRSVRGLLEDLREQLGTNTYILTRRLTQDRLEGFFGMVSGKCGSNSNPNPVDTIATVRLLTLLFGLNSGANPTPQPASGAPVSVPNPDQEQESEEQEQLQQL